MPPVEIELLQAEAVLCFEAIRCRVPVALAFDEHHVHVLEQVPDFVLLASNLPLVLGISRKPQNSM